MIDRKNLGLLILILVVSGVVAILNLHFLSRVNLSNTANLMGKIGIFAIAQAFVIISGGIGLSSGLAVAASFPTLLEWLTTGRILGVPNSPIAMGIIAVLTGILQHRSVYDRTLLATGRNPQAARFGASTRPLSLSPPTRLAPFLPASRDSILRCIPAQSPRASHGNFYELYAIAAAVHGGCSLWGGEGLILGVLADNWVRTRKSVKAAWLAFQSFCQ